MGLDLFVYWDLFLLFVIGCMLCDFFVVVVNWGLLLNMICGCVVLIIVKICFKSFSFIYFDVSYISYIEGFIVCVLSIL